MLSAVCLRQRSLQLVRLASTKLPEPKEINKQNAVFDQAWDQADYRLSRFEISKKQVNPNLAINLVAEEPAIASEEHVVSCDGGHPALGHPKVYINLDKPGTHACGYCGQRFYNTHATKAEDLTTSHIQV